jgi:hypothetical protein
MKNIFFTILTLALFSCEHNGEECCKNFEVDLLISITNGNGKDLLNPANGEININNFKLYYKTQSGDLVLFDKHNLDKPKGFKLVAPEESGNKFYSIDLLLNTEYIFNNDTSTTIINWSDEKSYEIITLFSKGNNSLFAERVFIDNKLVVDSGENRYITIID